MVWSHPETRWQVACAAVMTVPLVPRRSSANEPQILYTVICTAKAWFCFHLLMAVFWFFPLLIRSIELILGFSVDLGSVRELALVD